MEMENEKLGELTIKKLTEPYIGELASLSDMCVGEGMYPPEVLRAMMEDPSQYVYLVLGPEGDLAAYIYFHLIGMKEAAAIAKVSEEKFAALSRKADPIFAHMCSMGVAHKYRKKGISSWLYALSMDYIESNGLADAAFGTAWKINGSVAMDSNMLRQGFRHLQDSHMVWYDHPTLNCPVCHGRCRCDAAVYVKSCDKEEHIA